MPYDLKGRNVSVTGGSRGLGAVICRKFAAEGCNVAINYAANEDAARESGDESRSKYSVETVVIQGDVCKTDDCKRCVEATVKEFGGIDIVIANAGWTRFSTFSDLNALSPSEWNLAWSAQVSHPLSSLQSAMPHFTLNPEGGVSLITSSIAGTSLAGSSMAYSVSKAAQSHSMKCLAQTQGEKSRCNAVLPGMSLTEWGLRYGEERIGASKEKSVLKREVDLDDCADVYVMLAKNTSTTGQNFQIDSGINIANM